MRKKRDWIAAFTVYGAPKMTPAGRARIAKWLRSRANWFEKHGDLAAARHTARWMA